MPGPDLQFTRTRDGTRHTYTATASGATYRIERDTAAVDAAAGPRAAPPWTLYVDGVAAGTHARLGGAKRACVDDAIARAGRSP